MTLTEYIAELRRRSLANIGCTTATWDAHGRGVYDGKRDAFAEAAALAESVTPGWRNVTESEPAMGVRVVARLPSGLVRIMRRDSQGWSDDLFRYNAPSRYLPIPADEVPRG